MVAQKRQSPQKAGVYIFASRMGWHPQTPLSDAAAVITALQLLPVVPGHSAEEGSREAQATCAHSISQAASGAQGAALEKQPCLHGYPSTGGCSVGAGFVMFM